jgi:hypothetical protein
MTATKARGRHTADTSRTRVKRRRPKANSDNRRAKRVLEAIPAAPLAALAPDGPGDGGTLEDTDPNEAPDGETAPEPATGGESAGLEASQLELDPATSARAGEL